MTEDQTPYTPPARSMDSAPGPSGNPHLWRINGVWHSVFWSDADGFWVHECGSEAEVPDAWSPLPDADAPDPLAERVAERVAELGAAKDGAYEERNRVVALLASLFPSGVAKTDIPGWSEDWHGCVYIDLPCGQASWHFHDSQAHLFGHLPPYEGEWDDHTTELKYERIADLARNPAPAPPDWRDERVAELEAERFPLFDLVERLALDGCWNPSDLGEPCGKCLPSEAERLITAWRRTKDDPEPPSPAGRADVAAGLLYGLNETRAELARLRAALADAADALDAFEPDPRPNTRRARAALAGQNREAG